MDLLLPDPTLDLEELSDFQLHAGHQRRNADITLDPDSFMGSMEQPRGYDHDDDLQLEEDMLDLDIGEDRDLDDLLQGSDSMEIGRDAPPARDFADDLFDESRMSLDLGPDTPKGRESVLPGLGFEEHLDINLENDHNTFDGGMDIDFEGDTTIQPHEATPVPEATTPAVEAPAPVLEAPRERSESPLSSIRSTVERQLSPEAVPHSEVENEEVMGEADATFVANDDTMRIPSEEVEVAHRQQASRKRRAVVDAVTEIKAGVLRGQLADCSSILQEPSFLPRDPTVLALMSLTRTGGLARSVFYPKNIAPELASLLAPDFVKRMAELKRKRDAGPGVEEENDEEEEEEEVRRPSPKQARLEIEEEEEHQVEMQAPHEEDETREETMMEFGGQDDTTIMPLVDQEDYSLVHHPREGGLPTLRNHPRC